MEAVLKVEVISKETVKPSRPTHPRQKTITLSFLDESFPAIHVPRLLIYESAKLVPPFDDLIITTLKTSLSETLSHFPPFAGRFENEYTVCCNDEGIPFVVTHVNVQLKEVLNSSRKYEDVLIKFLPPQEMASLGQRPISEVAPLGFQVNLFTCGGIILGCYSIHKLIDATSMSYFLNYWAATASNRSRELVEPDFDAIVKTFPSLAKDKRASASVSANGATAQSESAPVRQAGLSQHVNLPIKVVAKSFKFSKPRLEDLKASAASETVPNPSSFEAVTGFVWKHVMLAVSRDNKEDNSSIPNMFTGSASLRARTKPPLPKEAMGNIIASMVGHVAGPDTELDEIVREIHAGVVNMKQIAETLQGENAGEAFLAERKAGFEASAEKMASKFNVGSWCKLGLIRVDFGFGKPNKISPLGIIYPFQRNSMMMAEYRDSNNNGDDYDGIEVYVCMVENQMQFLEANPQFLAFASPS